MKRCPSRCTSASQITRPCESTVETQPQLHPALLRLSAMISQYFTILGRVFTAVRSSTSRTICSSICRQTRVIDPAGVLAVRGSPTSIAKHLARESVFDALPSGRLWYAEPDAISNAIGYAKTAGEPDRAGNGVKLVYAKNTKWLLAGPHQLQKFAQ
jgi:hypothetical protein